MSHVAVAPRLSFTPAALPAPPTSSWPGELSRVAPTRGHGRRPPPAVGGARPLPPEGEPAHSTNLKQVAEVLRSVGFYLAIPLQILVRRVPGLSASTACRDCLVTPELTSCVLPG